MKKVISIVVPVYNEEENIPRVYSELKKVCEGLGQYDYEYIFVDDGSTDNSCKIISSLTGDTSVKYIGFSRNFGKELATTAGIQAARGDAVIIIDADLQHPPEIIPSLVSLWETGAEIVIGVRTSHGGGGVFKRVGSWFFYRIMGLISETSIKNGETDFRLIDRVVVDSFNLLSEHQRMTRSLINWLGFKKEYVMFVPPARVHGEARYSTRKLIHLAVYSFVTNSLLPLRVAGYLGMFITCFSGLLGVFVFFNKYAFGDPLGLRVSGSAELTLINVFLVGIVLMMLGIISLYIGNINTEVAGRPLYIVRKKINF